MILFFMRFLLFLSIPASLFCSGMVFVKYDKLVTTSNGKSVGNTAGFNIKDLTVEFTGAIKIDKLLKNKYNLSVNSADKSVWPGGADTSSAFYTNGYWSDTKKNNRLLGYYSDVGLSRGTSLKFAFECGQLRKPQGGDVTLYAYDNNVNRWIKVSSTIDFTTVYNGSNIGYTMLRFSINSNSQVIGDHRFTLIDGTIENENDSDGHIPANTLLAFASSTNSIGNINRLDILPRHYQKCECLCDMTISLKEAIGGVHSPLEAPLKGVKPIPLLTFSDGWNAKVIHFTKGKRYYSPASSTIDISETAKRERFVSEGNDTNFQEDTYTYKSVFALHLENEAEYGVSIDSVNDVFRIKVNRASKCALRSISFYTLVNEGTIHLKKREMYKDKKSSGYIFESNLKNFPFYINNSTNDWNRIVIEVDAKNPICQGMWRVDFSITPNEADKEEQKLLQNADAADWKIDGMKFIVPYLNTDLNYGTFIIITNRGDKKVSVYMDVYGDGQKDEGMASNSYYTNIRLGDIPRRSTRIYFPKDLNQAIWQRFPAFRAYRYMAQFIVGAPQNDIEAAAFQQDGGNGKRSIPVLTESLHKDQNGKWVGHRFHE